jgi:hypothetical protein
MKRKRTTNEIAALKAGVSAARSRRITIQMDDPAGGPREFLTTEEMMLRLELADMARLRWLLDLAQSAAIDISTISAQVAAFAGPNQRVGAVKGRLASKNEVLEFVRQFVADLKHFVEKRGTGIQWNLNLGEVSKTLSWEGILTGGERYRAADWRSAFAMRAAQLLDDYGVRIRQCANRDCGRMFIGDLNRSAPLMPGKQRFCSTKCGWIDRQRRFREKQGDWTEYRRSRRKRRDAIRKRQQQVQARLKTEREPGR